MIRYLRQKTVHKSADMVEVDIVTCTDRQRQREDRRDSVSETDQSLYICSLIQVSYLLQES